MQSIISIALALWFLICAAGAGRICRPLWRRTRPERASELLIDAALGFGILSLPLFALAALGGLRMFHGMLVWLPFAACSVPGAYALRDIVFLTRKQPRGRVDAAAVVTWVVLVILAVAALVPALAPPSMSDWDSLAYHLSVPKLWLEHGGMYRIDFMSHSNFPTLVETLYLPGLAAGMVTSAKLIHYLMGVLLVVSAMHLVRKHLNPSAAPLAGVALAGMPVVLWLATTAYVDLATALYTVLAAHFLLDYLDGCDRRSLVGCAIAAGFAASTKMTGLAVIPLVLAWLLADRLFSQKRAFEWKRGLMLVGTALLVCAPWYIKSIAYTGSPVYPFFYSVFGGRGWSAELASHYAAQQSLFGMGCDLTAFLMLPFNITFHSERFYDTPGLFVGPIFAVAVPILLLARWRSRKLTGLGLFFLALLVTWFALTHQSRYLVPGFAVLAALVATLAYEDARFRFARAALWVVFVSTAIFGVWTLYPAIAGAAPVVTGRETQDDYLARRLDVYSADQWINENLPNQSRIALFGDTRGFYLDRRYVWADPGHNVEFNRSFGDPAQMIGYLKSRGVTHALINFRFFPERGEGSEVFYQAIDEGLFEQVYPDGNGFGSVVVYEII